MKYAVRSLITDRRLLTSAAGWITSQRSAAALTYRHRQRTINMVVSPVALVDSREPRGVDRLGDHVLYWTDADMNYWVVSDPSPESLASFSQLVGQHAPTRNRFVRTP